MNEGGDCTGNMSAKIGEEVVSKIKSQLLDKNLPMYKIGEENGISSGMVSLINKGYCWRTVDEDKYSYPIRKSYIFSSGSKNIKAKVDEKTVLLIRKRYVDEKMNDIYIDYKDILSYSEFKKLITGQTFKQIPIYKKRKKIWELEGTCIDYPGEQE